MHKKKKEKAPVLRIVLLIVLVVIVLCGFGVAGYMIWERPPEIEQVPATYAVNKPVSAREPDQASQMSDYETEEEDDSGRPENERSDGVYLILLVGKDRSGYNTDTIMLCRFDTVSHTINVVSIPRDTYTNIDWQFSRKINCIYTGTKNMHLEPGPMDRLILEVGRLTGITADCYVLLDLNTFVEAVDIIGGITYDVPFDMDYDDYNQDLHIHLKAGTQVLDGQAAMGLWRFRSGFRNGDIGRLDSQHQFLRSVADQFLSIGNIPNIDKLIDLVVSNTETNLTAANFAWFARQYFKCGSSDVNFYTMPHVAGYSHELSYVFPDLEPWLEMINSCLNPYSREITRDDLECVCIDRERNAYELSAGTFVDPSYLHAWQYYPYYLEQQQKKAEKEAAAQKAAEEASADGTN